MELATQGGCAECAAGRYQNIHSATCSQTEMDAGKCCVSFIFVAFIIVACFVQYKIYF